MGKWHLASALAAVAESRARLEPGLIGMIKALDEGSEFDDNTAELRKLPEDQWLDALLESGFDALINTGTNGLAGVIGWQRKEEEQQPVLGIFGLKPDEAARNGLLLEGIRRLVTICREAFSVDRIQIGRGMGRHPATDELMMQLKAEEHALDIKVNLDNGYVQIN